MDVDKEYNSMNHLFALYLLLVQLKGYGLSLYITVVVTVTL